MPGWPGGGRETQRGLVSGAPVMRPAQNRRDQEQGHRKLGPRLQILQWGQVRQMAKELLPAVRMRLQFRPQNRSPTTPVSAIMRVGLTL